MLLSHVQAAVADPIRGVSDTASLRGLRARAVHFPLARGRRSLDPLLRRLHLSFFAFYPPPQLARSLSDPEWRNSRFAVTIFGSRCG